MSRYAWARCGCGEALRPGTPRYRVEDLSAGETCGHGRTAAWLCMRCFKAVERGAELIAVAAREESAP